MDDYSKGKPRIQEVKYIRLRKHQKVRLIREGRRFAEVVFMGAKPKVGVRKLSKEEYVVLSSGEIMKYKEQDAKAVANMKVAFEKLKRLLRTTFDS